MNRSCALARRLHLYTRPGLHPRARAGQRGVAAIELALLLPLLVILLLGMMDYGYYMFVSITAAQATREGARQLATTSITNCANTSAVTAATTVAQGTSGPAMTYMAQIGMSASTTVTATCLTSPVNPTWKLAVQVDYRPAIGYLLSLNLMPAGTAGKTRVRSSLYVRGR